MAILKYLMASRRCNMRALEVVGWRQGLTMVLLLTIAIRVVEGLTPTPPILPKRYQGNGNTLQLLLNESWPLAQGPASTFTFFAPENSAIKKYPCLFSKTGTLAKTIATSVIQYHLIPGRILASQDLQNLAAVADFMAATALPDQTLNVTVGGTKLNGYSQIDNPDIGTKESQVVHGIKMLLVPPSLLIGCGPLAPTVRSNGNTSDANLPLSMQLRRMRYADISLLVLSTTTGFLL